MIPATVRILVKKMPTEEAAGPHNGSNVHSQNGARSPDENSVAEREPVVLHGEIITALDNKVSFQTMRQLIGTCASVDILQTDLRCTFLFQLKRLQISVHCSFPFVLSNSAKAFSGSNGRIELHDSMASSLLTESVDHLLFHSVVQVLWRAASVVHLQEASKVYMQVARILSVLWVLGAVIAFGFSLTFKLVSLLHGLQQSC